MKPGDPFPTRWLITGAISLTIIILLTTIVHARTITFTSSGNTTWTVNDTVANGSIFVEVWGGGGGGITRTSSGAAGGGGAGAYSASAFVVANGSVFNISVAGGGSAGNYGGDSYFNTTSTVLAKGGTSAAANTVGGQPGGTIALGVGTIKYAGGNGSSISGANGGGGGGAAGTNQTGGNASGSTGGTAGRDGGNGGAGATGAGNDPGLPGSNPGGAGGGGKSSGGTGTGGTGGTGMVRITWAESQALYLSIYDEGNNSLLTQNVTVQVTNGTTGNIVTYYTNNGSLQVNNLDTGTITVALSTTGYGSRIYTIPITTTSINNMTAYLASTSNTVTFNVIDSISSAVIQDATVMQYALISGTSTLVDTKTTDITGNAQLSYITNNLYTFVISASGYNNKTFTLYPVLSSAYTIKMISILGMNFSEDYQNVLITYHPQALMANASNTFTVLFDSVTNSFTSYSYNISYPGGSSAGSGSQGAGETFITLFNITGGNVFSTANLSIIYNTGFGNKTFHYFLTIIYGPNNGNFVANVGNTYGMGLIERALVGTLILVVIVGMVSLTVGSLPALLAGLMIMGLFTKIGFWEWWLAGISFLIGLAIISRRTE